MYTRVRINRIGIVCAATLAVILGIVIFSRLKHEEEIDPNAGQVYLFDGNDWTWMTPLEGMAVNELTDEMFTSSGASARYIGADYDVLYGIDVSEHQKKIDWKAVSASDIDFAYIRIGRRGTTEGGLFMDEKFFENISAAKSCGLKIGVYFFSQAITVTEAIEEADFVIQNLNGYSIDLPVVFDWEKDERTENLDDAVLNDCIVAFCETVKRAGYEPCVYFNRLMGYYRLDLLRLSTYKLWLALPELNWPSFYYKIDIWQYTFAGSVPGIDVETDLNMIFIPKEPEQSQTDK